MRVRWLRRALENLNAEAEYIAQDSHSAACEMFQFVKASVDTLADFPAIGRPGRVPGTRELVIPADHSLPCSWQRVTGAARVSHSSQTTEGLVVRVSR